MLKEESNKSLRTFPYTEKKEDSNVEKNQSDNSGVGSFFCDKQVIDCIKTPTLNHLDIVKILLKERAMKQVQLADKIGLSRQALHNYLSGEWGVPTQIKIKIAQALGVDSSVIWDLK